jgi:hypothetical protein
LFGNRNPMKNPETRAKVRKYLLGHHVSQETRYKISKANSGKNHVFYGKKRPEHSKKMKGCKIWNKGKVMTDSFRKNVSRGLTGRPVSLQTRKKMSLSGQKVTEVLHHKYGKNYSVLLKVTPSQHTKLHLKAYFYILDKYGKQGIDDYINWFFTHENELKKYR